ncbi:hypothetical protein GOBAR_DD33380 [Gossypium barbadense]|nr:hypothetical protein GOBAR_DD33380 [Gossypium barbadense]
MKEHPFMAEVGESSGSQSSSQIWAKLGITFSPPNFPFFSLPLQGQQSDIEVCSDEMIVSSQITSSSQVKHDWCKITRNADMLTAMMQNKSSNDILVDDAVVRREDVVEIKCGTEMVLGPNREEYLSYIFKLMPSQETCKKKLKISVDVEHAKCSICLNIWHDVITIAPCLHNFCNGCFSEWLKRSRKKHSGVLCPQCRAVVQFAGRNPFLRNIEEAIRSERGSRRKRGWAYDGDEYASEESDDVGPQCPQCGLEIECWGMEWLCPDQTLRSAIGGFQCNQQTIHIQCQNCGGMMPSRADMDVPQHCSGCDGSFCGAYWQAQRVTRSEYHPVCNHETFRPVYAAS